MIQAEMPFIHSGNVNRHLLAEQRGHGDVHRGTAARLGRPPIPPEGLAAWWVCSVFEIDISLMCMTLGAPMIDRRKRRYPIGPLVI